MNDRPPGNRSLYSPAVGLKRNNQQLWELRKGDVMPKKTLAKRIAAAKQIKNIDEKILTLALLLPLPEKREFVQFLEGLLIKKEVSVD